MIGIQNPGFNDKDWNPVPGIRNPRRGIQNPRLSWIPLHGAIYSLGLAWAWARLSSVDFLLFFHLLSPIFCLMWLYALQLSKFRTRILDKINGKFRAISSLQIKDWKMVPFGLHAASSLLSGRGEGRERRFVTILPRLILKMKTLSSLY